MIAASTLCVCVHTAAAPIDDAWQYYDRSDFGKAAEIFRSLNPVPPQGLGALCEMAVAKKAITTPDQDRGYCEAAVAANDSQGMVSWGQAHLAGNDRLGVNSQRLGLGFLARAVATRYPVASEVLCNFYFDAKLFSQAAPFCKVAAASNLPGGLFNLARMSFEGKGAVQDFDKARKFALLSAALNNPSSYFLLAEMERTGYAGSARNPIRAYAWYSLAASAAPDWAEPRDARQKLDLSSTQVAAAQKAAGAWKTSANAKWRQLYAVAKH